MLMWNFIKNYKINGIILLFMQVFKSSQSLRTFGIDSAYMLIFKCRHDTLVFLYGMNRAILHIMTG